MSSISVKWQGANSAISKYREHRQDLSSVMASVRSVKSYRCMRGEGFSSVYNALDRVITRLEDEKEDIKKLETGMTDILKAYENCENRIAGEIKAGNAAEKDTLSEQSNTGEKGFIENLKNLIGDGVAVAGALGVKWMGVINSLNNTSTVVGEATKILRSSIGSSIAKWASNAGVFLTALNNLIENYEEFKDSGNYGRGVGETIIETGVDLLVLGAATYVATKVAGVAIVATGVATVTAAEALAIGAAIGVGAVALTCGANVVCKWATKKITGVEKDLGEVVADPLMDGVEALYERVFNSDAGQPQPV